MKNLIPLSLLLLACCRPTPTCPPDDEKSKPGIYSKPLGMVKVDGEDCHIFEIYEKFNCRIDDSEYNDPIGPKTCDGVHTHCQWKVLTRITKCPHQITINSIPMTPHGKTTLPH